MIENSSVIIPHCSFIAPYSLFLNILLLSKAPQLELDSEAATACLFNNMELQIVSSRQSVIDSSRLTFIKYIDIFLYQVHKYISYINQKYLHVDSSLMGIVQCTTWHKTVAMPLLERDKRETRERLELERDLERY